MEILKLTEKEYRALNLDSYSTVKIFLDDRKKYYRKFVLKEEVKENQSQESEDIRFGGLVDCLMFTPEEFDSKYIVTIAVRPSGQMETFVNFMYRLTKEATNDMGDLTRTILELMTDAYELLRNTTANKKLRDSFETFQKKFIIDRVGFDYYTELRDRGDKLVVTSEEVEQAHKVVDYLVNHPHTSRIFNSVTNERYEVIRQLIITGEVEGLLVKMMADLTIIDHQEKVIDIYDLKVMGNIDIFPYNFLKLKYYIQLAMYTTLVRLMYPDYRVNPVKFITVDKYRYMDPIIVTTNEDDYKNAINGFMLSNHRYKGLNDTINDIKFHKNINIWTSTREAQENNGLVTLKLYEEYDT